jgi:hypothetical protein
MISFSFKSEIRNPKSEMSPTPRRPSGFRRVVYWCGRGFQLLGLLLIWWVLLLFVSLADAGMGMLLQWSLFAATVFYLGWAFTVWGKRGG